MKHIYTRPYRPQTNGKIERLWKTIIDECLITISKGLEEKELEAEILGFIYRYNYERKHGGIEHQTPFEKLKKIAVLLPNL